VVIDDPVPAGVSNVSVRTTQGSCTSAVHCTLGELAVGVVTITVTATVDPGFVPAGQVTAPLTNTVTPSGPQIDPNSCTGCSVTVPVSASADLVTSKRALGTTAVAGETTDWEVVVTNKGPSVARAVAVTDTLPAGLSFVQAGSDNRCVAGPGQQVVCTLDDLAANTSITFVIRTLVAPSVAKGATVTNRVSATSATPDPDPSCAACSASIPVTREADIDAVKTLLNGPLVAGEIARWNVIVTNNGPSDATGVQFTDHLDANLRFDPPASDGRCSAVGQDVTCIVGDLANEESTTFVVATLVHAGLVAGTLISNAVVPTSDVVDPVPDCTACVSGPHGSTAIADMTIRKSGSSLVTPGLDTTYSMTVQNLGPSTARSVHLADPMMAGVVATGATWAGGACALVADGFDCDLGDIANQAVVTITVVAAVDPSVTSGSAMMNTARVTTATPDPNPANNTDSVTARATRSFGIVASKTVDQASVIAGRPVAYDIEVTNLGPSMATAVDVTDVVPSEIAQITVTPTSECSILGQTVMCAFAEMAPNAVRTVHISGTLAPNTVDGATIANTASVTCADGCTPPIEPSVEFHAVRQADVVTTKSIVTDPVIAGLPVTWRITVTNQGPSAADAVELTDQLDRDLAFVGSDPAALCDAAGQLVTCPLGTLAPAASTTVLITTLVAPSAQSGRAIANTVTATSDTVDPDPSCAQCTAVGGPVEAKADLRLTKTGAAAPVVAGTASEWTLTLTNLGPSDAQAVVINDTLDPRLSFMVADSDERCSVIGPDVSCAIGTLVSGGSATVRIVTRVDSDAASGSTVTNTASVTSSTPDPNPDCNTCTAMIDILASADLETVKELVTDPIVAGELVEWKITVTNHGPSTARAVQLSDELHTGLIYATEASSPACAAQQSTVTCDAGDMAPGTAQSFTIAADLDAMTPAGAPLTNTVVAQTPTPDPQPECERCTATGVIERVAHLWITKTGSTTMTAGVPYIWTLSFGNRGPSAASDVVVTDQLPAAMGSISVDAPAGTSCTTEGQTVRCTTASLAPQDQRTVTIHATPASSLLAGASVVNTATVASPEIEPR
jgi:uncharacterized repeat protein (TIGR01451 family)